MRPDVLVTSRLNGRRYLLVLATLPSLLGGCSTPGSQPSAAAPSQAHAPAPASASWADLVRAAVRPNIIVAEKLDGNPRADVDVWVASDGYILSVVLARSSGVAAWDQAVVRALQKTERLPLDKDGRVPSRVFLSFRPQETSKR